MQIDIGAYIADLLFEHDSVNIPGLGGFETAYKPASIDQVQGKLHPPSKEISFNKNLAENNGILVNYIVKKHGLSHEEAQKAVADYVLGVIDAIDKREIVVFPNVGRLYKDYEHNIQFLPDNTNFNTEAYGLPDVEFFPVMRNEREFKKKEIVKTSKSHTSGGFLSDLISGWFQDYLKVIIVLSVLVIGLGIYFIFFRSDPKPPELTTNVPESRINVRPTEDSVDESLEANEPGDTFQDAAIELETEAPTILPGQKYCIIGIGVFGSQENVNRLVEKIYEEGFEPYTEKKGRFTQVGVQFAYEEEEEVSLALENVRNKFDRNAMILKKGS